MLSIKSTQQAPSTITLHSKPSDHPQSKIALCDDALAHTLSFLSLPQRFVASRVSKQFQSAACSDQSFASAMIEIAKHDSGSSKNASTEPHLQAFSLLFKRRHGFDPSLKVQSLQIAYSIPLLPLERLNDSQVKSFIESFFFNPMNLLVNLPWSNIPEPKKARLLNYTVSFIDTSIAGSGLVKVCKNILDIGGPLVGLHRIDWEGLSADQAYLLLSSLLNSINRWKFRSFSKHFGFLIQDEPPLRSIIQRLPWSSWSTEEVDRFWQLIILACQNATTGQGKVLSYLDVFFLANKVDSLATPKRIKQLTTSLQLQQLQARQQQQFKSGIDQLALSGELRSQIPQKLSLAPRWGLLANLLSRSNF